MLNEYLEELKKNKLLSPAEEKSLWIQAKGGDSSAHQKLMIAYQPLVFKIAMSFKLEEAETMELIQEGMVGLLEAAESYDYTKGVAFSLFASYRIKGSMLDYLKKLYPQGIVSLEERLYDGKNLADFCSVAAVSPVELTEQHLLQEKVVQALKKLPEKEQNVLTEMYLEDKTAQSVAESINVSLGYVYRLQKQGIRRVRGMLSRFMHEYNKN